MDIVDKISNNIFLKKLFPYGLKTSLYLGQIKFDVEGSLSLNIHTKQKPSIAVDRWREWGRDYNVIVIKINGLCRNSAIIKNWKKADYSPLAIVDNIETFTIFQTDPN